MRIASFNILSSQFKFDMGLGADLENPEEKRRLQVRYLDSLNPDLLLLQEAEPLYGQVDYIVKTLANTESLKASNGLSLIYNKENLTLLNQGYVPTLSLQFASFEHHASGKVVHAMNVHLGGGAGSFQSLQAIAHWASSQWDLGSESIFIAGDMNINLLGEHYDNLLAEYPIFADPNRDKLRQRGGWLIDWILLNKGFNVVHSEWERPLVDSRHISDHPVVWADVDLRSFDEPFESRPAPTHNSDENADEEPSRKTPPVGLNEDFTFTGQNYFNIHDNENLIHAQDYSVSFWFRADTEINLLGQNYLISNQGYPFGWEFEIRAGVPYFEARVRTDTGKGRSSGVRIKGTTKVQPDDWYHVLVAFAEDEARIYLDGLLEGQTSLPGSFHYHEENPGLFLGTRWDLRNLFRGEIRQLRFFDTRITVQELERYLQGNNQVWDKNLPRLTVENHKQAFVH